jgi:hypothetical protein
MLSILVDISATCCIVVFTFVSTPVIALAFVFSIVSILSLSALTMVYVSWIFCSVSSSSWGELPEAPGISKLGEALEAPNEGRGIAEGTEIDGSTGSEAVDAVIEGIGGISIVEGLDAATEGIGGIGIVEGLDAATEGIGGIGIVEGLDAATEGISIVEGLDALTKDISKAEGLDAATEGMAGIDALGAIAIFAPET